MLLYNTGLQFFSSLSCRRAEERLLLFYFSSLFFLTEEVETGAEGAAGLGVASAAAGGGPAHVGAVRDRLFPRPDTVGGRQEEAVWRGLNRQKNNIINL